MKLYSTIRSSAGLVAAALAAAQAPTPALHIEILEGNGVINYFNQRTAQEPIVRIEDENRRPVAGAAVLFRLPDSGPGGLFGNGTGRLLVITDQSGRAAARGLVANNVPGEFRIEITATSQSRSVRGYLTQTNRRPAIALKAPRHGLSGAKTWLIVGIAAGAAAAGGIVAAGGSSHSIAPGGSVGAVASPGPVATVVIPVSTAVGPPR